MAYLHKKGRHAHMDIKTGNLVLDGAREWLQLIDLGMAMPIEHPATGEVDREQSWGCASFVLRSKVKQPCLRHAQQVAASAYIHAL